MVLVLAFGVVYTVIFLHEVDFYPLRLVMDFYHCLLDFLSSVEVTLVVSGELLEEGLILMRLSDQR